MKVWLSLLLLATEACFCLASPQMVVLDEYINKNTDLDVKLNNSTRIVAGYPATLGPPATAPWQVALVYGEDGIFCGGTLLSHQVVVTAAHCIEGIGVFPFTVQLGGLNRSSLPLTYDIKQTFIHEDYGGCDYENNIFSCDNDIALLILDNESNFSSYSHIEPANLPPADGEDDHANEIVRVSGWGKTSFNSSAVSDYLMAVELTLLPEKACKVFAAAVNANFTENMICASDVGSIKNACQGDSGGPLILIGNTSNTLLGVVSFGAGCAEFPGFYAKVTNYVSWINAKAAEGGAPLYNTGNIKNNAGLIFLMLSSFLVTWNTI